MLVTSKPTKSIVERHVVTLVCCSCYQTQYDGTCEHIYQYIFKSDLTKYLPSKLY